jgi:hypothetical protein
MLERVVHRINTMVMQSGGYTSDSFPCPLSITRHALGAPRCHHQQDERHGNNGGKLGERSFVYFVD